jgi:hypothetical protein
MQSLPARINIFTVLQTLKMNNNRLVKLPDSIGYLVCFEGLRGARAQQHLI